MANQEQLERLRHSVEKWNEWRRKYPEIDPDLSGANLNDAHLGGAYLLRTALSEASLNDLSPT